MRTIAPSRYALVAGRTQEGWRSTVVAAEKVGMLADIPGMAGTGGTGDRQQVPAGTLSPESVLHATTSCSKRMHDRLVWAALQEAQEKLSCPFTRQAPFLAYHARSTSLVWGRRLLWESPSAYP